MTATQTAPAVMVGVCEECGYVLRPRGTHETTHPGTRPPHNTTQCKACYTAAKRHVQRTNDAPDLRFAASALTQWLDDRRRRGVPANGYDIGLAGR